MWHLFHESKIGSSALKMLMFNVLICICTYRGFTGLKLCNCWLHNRQIKNTVQSEVPWGASSFFFPYHSRSCSCLQPYGSFPEQSITFYLMTLKKSQTYKAWRMYIRSCSLGFLSDIHRNVIMKALIFLALLGAACKRWTSFLNLLVICSHFKLTHTHTHTYFIILEFQRTYLIKLFTYCVYIIL